ncbi:MAG: Aminodeoxychorismate lyase [Microgenomates group bacterium GW2011_GWC1_49_7]|nr:MAG: Aminodeoxychorismate lyase [Microgenomates group bacterium GW2011_GWC1_49_7]
MARLIILFVIVVLGAWGGWFWWRDAISAVDPTDTTPIIFVVERGEGAKAIAADLANQNLIHSPTGFYLLVKLLGVETQLQAGDFRLNKSMDARTIALELTHGTLDVWVTTLEGWRVEEIATQLAGDLDIPEKEFLKYAREGYMFPDTYLIPRDATASAIAKIFLDNFEKKITPQMREGLSAV